jgi:hypothetical protein
MADLSYLLLILLILVDTTAKKWKQYLQNADDESDEAFPAPFENIFNPDPFRSQNRQEVKKKWAVLCPPLVCTRTRFEALRRGQRPHLKLYY